MYRYDKEIDEIIKIHALKGSFWDFKKIERQGYN